MSHSIKEAKQHLSARYRHEEGFVGVGIGCQHNEDVLCVYVVDSTFPLAQQLKKLGEFEGFPVEVEETGHVQAFPQAGSHY